MVLNAHIHNIFASRDVCVCVCAKSVYENVKYRKRYGVKLPAKHTVNHPKWSWPWERCLASSVAQNKNLTPIHAIRMIEADWIIAIVSGSLSLSLSSFLSLSSQWMQNSEWLPSDKSTVTSNAICKFADLLSVKSKYTRNILLNSHSHKNSCHKQFNARAPAGSNLI